MSRSAPTTAFAKNDVKPSRTPCFFSNASLWRARASRTAVMSISLNVVRIAAVDCASTRRAAIVRRSRDISSRRSRGSGARCSAAAGAAVGAAPGEARSARTSPFVIRPPGPVADTSAGASPCSAISLRAAGPERESSPPSPRKLRRSSTEMRPPGALRRAVRGSSSDAAGVAAGGAVGATGLGAGGAGAMAGVGAVAGVGARVGSDACGAARTAVSGEGAGVRAASAGAIRPITAPTATSCPSAARISASTPALGAPSSTVAFSVSSSTTGSSATTASPVCFSHLAIVASVIDSPSTGTTMSMITTAPLARVLRDRRAAICEPREALLAYRERIVEQLGALRLVAVEQTGCGRGRRGPARIARLGVLAPDFDGHLADQVLDVLPRAHVARLLLAPDEVAVAIRLDQFRERVRGERIELLDAQQVDVVRTARLALGHEVVVDLAGAQHELARLFGLARQ